MALKDKYKTDSEIVAEGQWFDFEENSDGSIPGFKLRIANRQNKAYAKALRVFAEKYGDESGTSTFDSLSEKDAEAYLLEVFVNTVLIEWRNFQPDDNGVETPYSKENAMKLFGSSDWGAFYDVLTAKAKKISNYQQRSLAAQAKNL